MVADKASQAGVQQLVCSKWVGARCWCAGLLLASVVSGRALLLHVSVVSVRAILLFVGVVSVRALLLHVSVV